VASPITVKETWKLERYDVNTVQQESAVEQRNFDEYLRETMAHLKEEDRSMLEVPLRRYKHLFYGLESEELGCTGQVEHSIERGDATPKKRTPIEFCMR